MCVLHLFKGNFRSLCLPQHSQKRYLNNLNVRFFHKSLMSTAKALSQELDIGFTVFLIEKGLMLIYWTQGQVYFSFFINKKQKS